MRAILHFHLLTVVSAACHVLPRGVVAPRAAPCMASKEPPEEAGIAEKAVWFATEVFGKAAAAFRAPDGPDAAPSVGERPRSLDEAIERLAADYAGTAADPRPYFLTGRHGARLIIPAPTWSQTQ